MGGVDGEGRWYRHHQNRGGQMSVEAAGGVDGPAIGEAAGGGAASVAGEGSGELGDVVGGSSGVDDAEGLGVS